MGAPNGIGVLINKNRFGALIQKLTAKTTDIWLKQTVTIFKTLQFVDNYLQATVSDFCVIKGQILCTLEAASSIQLSVLS